MAQLGQSGEGAVDVLIGVGRHEGEAQAGRAGRDGGGADALGIDAAGQQGLGDGHGLVGLAHEEGHDVRRGGGSWEMELLQAGVEAFAHAGEGGAAALAFSALDEVERGGGGCGHGDREGGGEDEAARALDEIVDEGGTGGHIGAKAAEGLTEGADLEVGAKAEGRAGAAFPKDAHRMRLIHEEEGVVAAGEADELGQRGSIAIHGEDGIGEDEASAVVAAGLEAFGQGVEVEVGIDVDGGARQARAIDEGGVVQGIGVDGVLGADERGDDTDIGVVPGVEEEGGVGALPGGDALFEPPVGRQVADDETGGAGAKALALHGVASRCEEGRVVGQTEIVVGAEVDGGLAIDQDFGRLGAVDGAHAPSEAALLQDVEFIEQRCVRGRGRHREGSCIGQEGGCQ